MGENDTRRAAEELKEKLQELSHKNLIDTAVARWTEDRDARKKQHNPVRNK
jgi:uncharacterized membrane protein